VRCSVELSDFKLRTEKKNGKLNLWGALDMDEEVRTL
jgi:hypothetical protein